MRSVKIFINNHDRLTTTRALVDYLLHIPGAYPVIIDNASTYPPLLEWYEWSCPVPVVGCVNYGAQAPWDSGMVQRMAAGQRYVVTDADLDICACPADLLDVLSEGLDRYSDFPKCGLSLEITDLPDWPLRPEIMSWEAGYWTTPLDSRYFDADIDTTFALYRGPEWEGYRALRTRPPYTARHIPWYGKMDDEECYYLEHASAPEVYWTARTRDLLHSGSLAKG
jgi:hypothetical protein